MAKTPTPEAKPARSAKVSARASGRQGVAASAEINAEAGPAAAGTRPRGQVEAVSPADLDRMDRDTLLDLWRDRIGGRAPKSMSLIFLRRFLAFAVQAAVQGNLAPALLTKLDRIAAGQDRPSTPTLKPGGRLIREWNGVTHVVDVTTDGYLWQGQRHRSLSVIARTITGAHWSGPRFFGLKEAMPKPPQPQRTAASRRSAGGTQ